MWVLVWFGFDLESVQDYPFFPSSWHLKEIFLRVLVTDDSNSSKFALGNNHNSDFCFLSVKVELQVVKDRRRKHSSNLQFLLSNCQDREKALLGCVCKADLNNFISLIHISRLVVIPFWQFKFQAHFPEHLPFKITVYLM